MHIFWKLVKFIIGFTNTGNVLVAPVASIKITKDGSEVDSFRKILESVKPGANRDLFVEWQTKKQELGKYTADVSVDLDGTGKSEFDTGVPFLDHMMDQIARHGLVDISIKAKGDTHIDDHHTVEDIGITLGQAFAKALGDKKGIYRYGHAYVPLDESLSRVVIDFSGRPGLEYGVDYPRARIGEFDVDLVLEFFQGFVNVDVLRQMGDLETVTGEDFSLPQVRGLTRQAGTALLDRAAEVGLLTAHGDGYYTIHPALPWYFRSLFDQYYPQSPISSIQSPARAFVEAMGGMGNYYHNQYEAGNRDVIGALTAEEANLLHARRLARRHGWWGAVISTMQGYPYLNLDTRQTSYS